MGALNWGDIFFDIEANRMATELYGEAVARIVKDPETAAALVPDPPVRLQAPDHRPGLLRDVQPRERDSGRSAQGSDRRGAPDRASTPSANSRPRRDHLRHRLRRHDRRVHPHEGARPRRHARSASSGPRRGRCRTSASPSPGSPICSPSRDRGAPRRQRISSPPWSSTSSGSGTASAYLREHGYRTIDALPEAQREWIEHATSLVAPTVLVHPSCNSWYNGANVPGKKRMYMGYTAGIPEYRRRCDEIADAGLHGFTLA